MSIGHAAVYLAQLVSTLLYHVALLSLCGCRGCLQSRERRSNEFTQSDFGAQHRQTLKHTHPLISSNPSGNNMHATQAFLGALVQLVDCCLLSNHDCS